MADSALKEMYGEMSKTWEDIKKNLDVRDVELKKFGEMTQETKDFLAKQNDRMDELEAKLNAPNLGSGSDNTKSVEELKELAVKEKYDASMKALRYGIKLLSENEQKMVDIVSLSEAKTMNLSSESSGGILAPIEIVAGILQESLIYSNMRAEATVRNTSSKSLLFRKKTTSFPAHWIGEMGQKVAQGDMSFDWAEVPNHELYADVQVSEQLMEDETYNLEQEIQTDAGEQFGLAEAAAFLSGSGANQPEGLLTNSKVPSIATGTASTMPTTADVFVTTYYDLPELYAPNAKWYMRRISVRDVRLLKDSTGNYIWEKSIAVGAPATILGAPIVEFPDLPLVGAGTTPILFGDMKRTYIIVDRINFVVKRLLEAGAKQGIIEYIIRRRVGGQVLLPNAMRKIRVATS